MKHPSLMLFLGAATLSGACGPGPSVAVPVPRAVRDVPDPAALLSFFALEIQDGLATALPEGACVTRDSNDEAPMPREVFGTPESWRFAGCNEGSDNVSLFGERHVWRRDADSGIARSRFAYTRRRGDGATWAVEGQTEIAARQVGGAAREQRTLMHGTMTAAGPGARPQDQHVYAYHMRVTEGLDGPGARRLWGVAQLNFASVEATSQVKLASLILTPTCPWPVYGHVSVATTAGDGSFVDATLSFTEMCGVVRDAQGTLTTLAMPWEEGA